MPPRFETPSPCARSDPSSPLSSPSLRNQYHALRCPKTRWPICSRVPVQSADSLQQNVHWTDIRDEKVGVDVERLFERLGADHHHAARQSVHLADRSFYGVVQQLAVFSGEAAVMQRRPLCNRQHHVFPALSQQRTEHLLRARDRVANHEDLGPIPSRGHGRLGNRAQFAQNRDGAHRNRLCRPAGRDRARLRGADARRERERRVGDVLGIDRRRRRRTCWTSKRTSSAPRRRGWPTSGGHARRAPSVRAARRATIRSCRASLACTSSTTRRLRDSEAARKCAHLTRNPASKT